MGTDKARIRVGELTLAEHVAGLLAQVSAPALEVGPGRSGLVRVTERHPGSGPLAALGEGVGALAGLGYRGAVLVLATDLPALDLDAVRALADWPGAGTVVPRLDGRAQPLCARWSAADLSVVAGLLAGGERALAPLLQRPGVEFIDTLDPRALQDADTPADLEALGLDWRPS